MPTHKIKFQRSGQARLAGPGFEALPYFGGRLCTRRKYRTARPLSTKHPIHLVLRSTQATGTKSFLAQRHRVAISHLLINLGKKWGIRVQNLANVGNHLHLQIKIGNRHSYKPFICALTGGIATIVTQGQKLKKKFWDYRPYSRIVRGLSGHLKLKDYLEINQYEGGGVSRCLATLLVRNGQPHNTG